MNHVEGAEEVGVKYLARLYFLDFFDRPQEPKSGVVYKNIDAVVDGPRLCDRCCDILSAAHIERKDGEAAQGHIRLAIPRCAEGVIAVCQSGL
jgi:hypothetical protein